MKYILLLFSVFTINGQSPPPPPGHCPQLPSASIDNYIVLLLVIGLYYFIIKKRLDE
jgi:hypothetical protein